MDWRRLERLAIIATITLYAAAVVSLIIMLGESLLPESSPVQRAFHDTANWLSRLGSIGGGTIIVIILLVLAGGGTVIFLLRAIDQFRENQKRREQERAEWQAASRAQGRAEGRAEVIEKLKDKGINVDELLPPQELPPEERWLFP